MMKRLLRSLFILCLIGVGAEMTVSTAPGLAESGHFDPVNMSETQIRQMLHIFNLQHLKECLPNSVAIVYGRKNKTVCAHPTSSYPPGYYSFGSNRQLTKIGGGSSESTVGSGPVNNGQNGTVFGPGGNSQNGTVVGPGGNSQNGGGLIQGGPSNGPFVTQQIVNAPLPAIMAGNGAAVPDNHGVHIKQILARRNIQLTSCSNSPVTIFRISHYTVCAIGSPQFPAGNRFEIDTYLPF